MFINKKYTAAQLMGFITKTIPYSNHTTLIEEVDSGIIIKWRSTTLKVSNNLEVYEVKGEDGYEIACGSDISILFCTLLKRVAFKFEMGELK